ncbi:hypothetical protein ACEQ8H_003614 [Pleosporales sp. CAS-2024a]
MAAATTTTEPMVVQDSGSDHDRIDSVSKARLTQATTHISMSPELFEKLYLQPKTGHTSENVAKFANATPLGFLGVFWLSFGMLQLPTLGLAASYSPTGNAAQGLVSKEMNAVIALYLLVWGFALGTFWLFTIRINLVFASIFFFVTIGAWVLSGAYWALSNGHFSKALKLQKAGGALLFVVACLGWYMLFVIMAAEMRWSMCPPVGDLSHYWAKTDVELGEMESEKTK